ncbi:MAG: alpha/beta hydrolase [Sulfurimonadaceae bacterium]
MKFSIKYLLFVLPAVLTFTSCSYIDTVQRAKKSQELKGTAAYYDNKCLVAEECAGLSAKVLLPASDKSDSMAIAVVVEDGNESRVIDVQVIDFTQDGDAKVSYFFFDLPVGTYSIYALTTSDHNSSYADGDLSILAMDSGTITENDLKAYQNAIIVDDILINSEESSGLFSYSLKHMKDKLTNPTKQHIGYFEKDVNLDDPVFSHQVAMEGLYYPESFKKKSKAIYRLAPEFKKGTIPILFVHGMGGTPRDWKFMIENLDLEHYTPYVLYYPSGEDFTKLATQYNGWIISDKIFDNGPGVVVAHSFGGIIVRDAINLEHDTNRVLFISMATPYGGDAKASEGVKNAPYVIPSWRSIADDGDFIKNLYRQKLSDLETFELIFAYNNSGDGESGDGRVPLDKQLRSEAQKEARSIRGFNEDHISILNSKETAEHINTLLEAFAKENIEQQQK